MVEPICIFGHWLIYFEYVDQLVVNFNDFLDISYAKKTI